MSVNNIAPVPIVHCITNYVVANFVANGLVAAGASPIMGDEEQEVAELVQLADALSLNLGTLTERTVRSMKVAGEAALEKGIPRVVDPVGAGASAYRLQSAKEVMAEFNTSIPMDDSMALVPKGAPVLKDERLTIDYTMNVNGTPTPDAFGRLDGYIKNNGVGFGVLTVGASSDKANLIGKQKAILESTKFIAPKNPPQLVGCWLDTDSEVSDGFSFFSSTKIELQSNGQYRYTTKSSAGLTTNDSMGNWASDTTAENGNGTEVGTYFTMGNVLFLQSQGGERSLTFEYQNGVMYFNGSSYGVC